jgi:ABC-2 type transport system ATP-binding protein
MPVDITRSHERHSAAMSPPSGPVVIEVRDVEKTFRIPAERVTRLKERALNPFSQRKYRELHALHGISFDIGRGEFFGIVGRNGSGKSTLLKILASIYASDAGTVRIAGLPAPFIELGVGFNMELTARENIELNGVMMGLPRPRARERLDAVLEFAELEDFVDMKLKNYSSGMLVRLAFSVMIQSDADILLIDEVLAVGDAAFQQKCTDVFREIRDSDRTVVLVTHDMSAVETYCHRAMLLNDGALEIVGDPDEVAKGYLRLNFERRSSQTEEERAQGQAGIADVRLIDVWLESAGGERTRNVEQGRDVMFHAVFEAVRDTPGPMFGFVIANADGVDVAGFGSGLESTEGMPDRMAEGDRVHLAATIENRLAPGRHIVKCWVHRNHNLGEVVFDSPHIIDFVVFGPKSPPGVVSLVHDLKVVTDDDGRSQANES